MHKMSFILHFHLKTEKPVQEIVCTHSPPTKLWVHCFGSIWTLLLLNFQGLLVDWATLLYFWGTWASNLVLLSESTLNFNNIYRIL